VIRKLAIVALAALPLLAAGPALAQDHVVNSQDMAARLSAAQASRQHDLAAVDRFLVSPEAQAAAASVRADARRLRDGLGALSDQDLAQLAARADALADPVAGLDQDIRTLLVIFLIVAIVILVLQAVD
jgi:hypothetical protein